MEKYPRIKELNIELKYNLLRPKDGPYVHADDLESILNEAQCYYKANNAYLSVKREGHHTHKQYQITVAIPTYVDDPRATKIEELEKKVQDIMKELEGLKG
jgi:hypothetical protein